MLHRIYCMLDLSENEKIALLTNDYLEQLTTSDRKNLKEELIYNLQFAQQFKDKMKRIYHLFVALMDEDDNKIDEIKDEIKNEGKESNQDIVSLYQYYMNDYWEYAAKDMEAAQKQYFRLPDHTLYIQEGFAEIIGEMI